MKTKIKEKTDMLSDIDLVYLWVDGNDPLWQEKKNKYLPEKVENSPERYENNEELRYSLRSVEKFAPWIRHIFLVTDGQKPDWLNTDNQKIRIVDHEEIIPTENLPCFNSNAIEIYLYKIPRLSERFLYANDDMFFGKPTLPADFFAPDGFPIIRSLNLLKVIKFYGLESWHKTQYFQFIHNANLLIKRKYGKRFLLLPHHCIDAYLRSDLQRNIEDIFKNEFYAAAKNRLRNSSDIQRILHNYTALAEKRGHLKYVTEKESFPVLIQNGEKINKLNKTSPLQFCLNDTEIATAADRTRMKEFLESYFPEKSSFER